MLMGLSPSFGESFREEDPIEVDWVALWVEGRSVRGKIPWEKEGSIDFLWKLKGIGYLPQRLED